MPRVKFKKYLQIKFLKDIQKELGINNLVKLAKVLGVHQRSLSDWNRAKYTLPEEVFKKCIKLTKDKINLPAYKVLPDFWSIHKVARRGGLVTSERYGGPGTLEGRRKGGKISQERRRLNPERYQYCNLRKVILKPKNSLDLAEFVGILLGDGGINSDCQVVITLHREDGKYYVPFVCNLIKKLFGVDPAVYHPSHVKSRNVAYITISSTSVVEFLLSKGLKKGNKIKNQVGVPKWIRDNKEFSKRCLRGLIDTDGCVYSHTHASHGYDYFNLGLNFSNKSFPLLTFVRDTLISLDFNAKLFSKGVNLYREAEVCRYAREINFSNPHHVERLKRFLKIKQRRGAPNGKEHAWKACARKGLQVRILSPPPSPRRSPAKSGTKAGFARFGSATA